MSRWGKLRPKGAMTCTKPVRGQAGAGRPGVLAALLSRNSFQTSTDRDGGESELNSKRGKTARKGRKEEQSFLVSEREVADR